MPWIRRPKPPIYTFRVRLRGGFYAPDTTSQIQRTIEISADQTLADLGDFIPFTFDFEDPHLWSFFLSGKPWDASTEYALSPTPSVLPGMVDGESGKPAARTRIRDVPYPGKTGKKEFLYLFDYGDQWEFGVKLLGTSDEVTPGVVYPRLIDSQGEAPPQYPDLDDEEWDGWEGIDGAPDVDGVYPIG